MTTPEQRAAFTVPFMAPDETNIAYPSTFLRPAPPRASHTVRTQDAHLDALLSACEKPTRNQRQVAQFYVDDWRAFTPVEVMAWVGAGLASHESELAAACQREGITPSRALTYVTRAEFDRDPVMILDLVRENMPSFGDRSFADPVCEALDIAGVDRVRETRR